MSVTIGCCQQIANDAAVSQPVMQVLEIKPIGNAPSIRYRMTVTDGQSTLSAMLATQMHHWISEDKLKPNCLIKLLNYVYQKMPSSTNKLLVCIDLEVVDQLPSALLGTTSSVSQTTPSAPIQQNASYIKPVSNNAPSYGSAPYAQSAGSTNQTISNTSATQAYGSSTYAAKGPVVREDSIASSYLPISALTPYANKWTIKARVTRKTDIKRWSNAKGEGTLFSIDLTDASSSIRATFFKEASDKFFPIISEGSVYTFSLGKVKLVQNKQFSTLPNPYELQFEANAEIRPAPDDDKSIGQVRYNFIKIRDIQSKEVGSDVDVIGIVKTVGDVQEINSTKLNKLLYKRDLVIFDDSRTEVRLTLWGEKATDSKCDSSYLQQIIALKGVKVGDFGGKNLSSTAASTLTLNPRIDEAQSLYHWHMSSPDAQLDSLSTASSSLGGSRPVEALDKRRTVSSVKEDNLGMSEKGDYISFRAIVKFIKHEQDPYYTACPNEPCNKKVTELGNGMWRCEKCNKEFPTCKRRYILNLTVTDHTGEQWVSLFNDDAEILLGMSADELHALKEQGDEATINSVYHRALFKTYVFSARVKMETVNDEPRLKCTITKADSIDYVSEAQQMLAAIQRYN